MQEISSKEINSYIKQEGIVCVYLYTPLCGTCQVAGKILEIIVTIFTDIYFRKIDINYIQEIAVYFEVESVPCLLILKDGVLKEKIYAFHSVSYLYEILKKMP